MTAENFLAKLRNKFGIPAYKLQNNLDVDIMATREENLKKINDELEIMDDEELDNVVGGSVIICNAKGERIQAVEAPNPIQAINSPKPYDSIDSIKTFRIG